MQVTPAVAREWARETGFKEFEKQTAEECERIHERPGKKYPDRVLVPGKAARKIPGFSGGNCYVACRLQCRARAASKNGRATRTSRN